MPFPIKEHPHEPPTGEEVQSFKVDGGRGCGCRNDALDFLGQQHAHKMPFPGPVLNANAALFAEAADILSDGRIRKGEGLRKR